MGSRVGSLGQLRLLGPVELVFESEPLRIGGVRQRAVLAYLAMSAGKAVLAATLVDAVWGESAPKSVAKSLTTLLARLRKPVERCGGTIKHTGAGYVLTLPDAAIDVAVFEQLVNAAKIDAATDRHDLAAGRLRVALALWRGPLLADLMDVPFVAASSAFLTARRIVAEDAFVDALVQTGELVEAVAVSHRLVEATPFHEDRWVALVRTLACAGRQRSALDECQRVRSLLRDELGISPSKELREVEAEVLDQLASVRAPVKGVWASPRFIGRATALDTLERSLAELPRVVMINGEAGIGKTALATEFGRRARRSGATVVHAACVRDDLITLGPLTSALEPLVPAPLRKRLRIAVPSPRVGDREATTIPRDEIDVLTHRRQRVTVEACQEIAGRGLLVVVLDDAQWADRVTLAVLRELAAAIPNLLLLLTVRSEDSSADGCLNFFEEAAHVVPVESLRLAPFSVDEIAALVESHAFFPGIETVTAEIARASGGNPLYASQLARLMQTTGGVLPDALPSGIRALMLERLREVPTECRQMLEVASLLRNEFSIETLAAVLERDPLDVAVVVAAARQAGLVRPTSKFDHYEFVHGLLEQVIREALEPSYRARLHAAVGRASVSNDPDAAISRALHLRAASPVEDAGEIARSSMVAGAMAMRTASFDLAASMYRTAIEFAGPRSVDCLDAHIRLGEILFAQGHRAEGEPHIAIGVEGAEAVSRWDLVADAILARRRLGFLPTTNDALAEAARVESVLRHISRADVVRRIALLSWMANALVNIDAERTACALDEADELACYVPESLVGFDVRLARVRQAESAGADPRIGIQKALSLYHDARSEGAARVAVCASALAESSRLRAGDLEWTSDHHRFVEFAQESGHVEAQLLLEATIAARAFAAEPLVIAEARSDDLLELGTKSGLVATLGLWGMQVFGIRREQLRLHEMEPLLAAAAETGRVGLQGLLAACRLEAGDQAGARSLIDTFVIEVLPKLTQDWVHDAAIALVADAAFALGEQPSGDLYGQLEASAGQVIVMCSCALVVGRTDRYLGQLAALRGDRDLAIEHLMIARELDAASGFRLGAGWAAHDEAAVRTARSDPADSRRAQELREYASTAARWSGSRRLARALDR